MRIFRAFFLLALLSTFSALFGLGLSYQRHTSSLIHTGASFNVGRDGWLKDGAKLEFPALAKRGNRLILQFNSWRPDIPATVLNIRTCTDAGTEYLVEANTVIQISLRGDCQPFNVQIQVKNPVRLSPTDPREVGAQLTEIGVTSRLGIALISPPIIAVTSIVLFLIASLSWLLLRPFGLQALSLLVPAISFYPLMRVDISALDMPMWLGASLCLLLLGAFARRSDTTEAATCSTLATLIALLITGVGTYLRFHGIDFGLPANFHPDEVPKVNAIMTMVNSHSLNPRYFLHPSLLLYLSYALTSLMDYLGLVEDFRVSAFLAGRCVSAMAGSLSIYLLYLIARRLGPPLEALSATLLFALMPLHVTCSRYLKEDALLLMWILLTVLVVLRSAQDGKPRLLFLAAICAGLATSTKYSGVLAAGIVATAPWLRAKSFRPDALYFRYALAAGCLIPLAFIFASPYIVLDPQNFASDFHYERNHMLRGHTEVIDAWSQFWMYHVGYSLQKGITLLPLITGLLGLGFALAGRKAEGIWIALLALGFYLPAEWVKSKPAPQPERYIVPCLPFVALLSAQFLHRLAQFSRWRPLALLLLLATFAQPAYRTISLSRDISSDTRLQMRDWILANIPAGSSIIADWEPYSAPLPQDKFSVEYIRRININSRLSIRALKQSGKDYLLLSSLFYGRYFTQPRAEAAMKARFRTIFRHVPALKQFSAASGSYAFHNPVLTIFSLHGNDFTQLESELERQRKGQLTQTSNQLRAPFEWAGDGPRT